MYQHNTAHNVYFSDITIDPNTIKSTWTYHVINNNTHSYDIIHINQIVIDTNGDLF